jgi:hypothetical protein
MHRAIEFALRRRWWDRQFGEFFQKIGAHEWFRCVNNRGASERG